MVLNLNPWFCLVVLQYNQVVEVDEKTKEQVTTRCVLETTDDDDKTPLIEVCDLLIRRLKPHQVEGGCSLNHGF